MTIASIQKWISVHLMATRSLITAVTGWTWVAKLIWDFLEKPKCNYLVLIAIAPGMVLLAKQTSKLPMESMVKRMVNGLKETSGISICFEERLATASAGDKEALRTEAATALRSWREHLMPINPAASRIEAPINPAASRIDEEGEKEAHLASVLGANVAAIAAAVEKVQSFVRMIFTRHAFLEHCKRESGEF